MTALSLTELSIYLCGWILANVNYLYNFFKGQSDVLENDLQLKHSLRDLTAGWSLVPRLKDVSDVEWTTWKYFIQISWYYMIIQFVVSEIIRRKHMMLALKCWYILSTAIFTMLNMGIRPLLIICFQPMIFATVLYFRGKRIAIWVIAVILLASYNSLKYKYFFWRFLDHDGMQDEEVYLILFTIAWVKLRCISFCIDYMEKKEKLEKDKKHQSSIVENLINMFSYVLYLPFLYVGPMILYEDFEKSFDVKNEKLSLKLKKFIIDMILFFIYTLLLDLSLHYFYFYAMQSNLEAVKQLPTLALCGAGLWMGLEFYVKYVISYGTTTAYSRLDNVEPPPTPRCILRIHVYSQMWRYFDVGLYRFLVKYIYKPSFEIISEHLRLTKMTNKFLASLVTFLFIFMWHGTMTNILIWSVLNYIGILLEYTGKNISQTDKYKRFKERVLKTDAMETRFIAFLCVPLLALSAISNFYLFAGTDVGNLYFGLLYQPRLHNCFIVFVSLYCCCHVSIALKDIPSRTEVKRIKA